MQKNTTKPKPVPISQFTDISDNVQIRLKNNGNRVYFLFIGALGIPFGGFNFLQKANLLNENLIIYRDLSGQFFVNGINSHINSLSALIEHQKKILNEHPHLTEIIHLGASGGGLPALVSAAKMTATAAFLFAPAYPTKEFPIEERNTDPSIVDAINPIQSVSQAHKTKFIFFHNKGQARDSFICAKYTGLKNCKVIGLTGSQHEVFSSIEKQIGYENLFEKTMIE
jgi:hypothetical protein